MHKLLVALVFALCPFTLFAADDEKQYFAVFMDGKKIGHAINSRTVTPTQVTTSVSLSLSITRAGMAINVGQSEITYETPKGKPIGFKTIVEMSGMKQSVAGKILGDKIQVTADVAGTSQTQSLDWPQGALMSEGLRLLQLEKTLAPGTKYSAKVFSPSAMSAIEAEMKIVGPESVDLLGRVVKLTKTETTLILPTGQMTQIAYVDSSLTPLKTIMPVMGFTLEMVACDKSFALSKNDVVDFIDKSLVSSPVSLKDAVSAKSIEYIISPKPGAQISFPTTSAQIVQTGSPLKITAIPQTAPRGVAMPYKGNDPQALEALKPSRYIQSDSDEIKTLAKQARASATDAATAAANIEKFVRGYINEKDYSVGYASAVEVAQSRQGDCTEHAVLMASLCQASGIPARVAVGLLYTDEFANRSDVFVGHAWTQCLIGEKWIDYDATRHAVGPTRIILATGNGDPEQFFSMVATFGNFTIDDAQIKN